MKITRDFFDAAAILRDETLFHTANGYLGVRGNFEEGYPAVFDTVRGCYINGFYDTADLYCPEKTYGLRESAQHMVNLPDLQNTKFSFDGEEFSMFTGEILAYSRELDMDAGTVTRAVNWLSPKGKELRVTFTRIASFTRRELFLTEISVEGVGCEGKLTLISECNCDVKSVSGGQDSRKATEREPGLHMTSVEISGSYAVALCDTSKSGLSVAAAMGHTNNQNAVQQTNLTPSGFRTTVNLEYGSAPAVIQKYCAYSDSRRHDDCKKHALTAIGKAMSDGAKTIFMEQRGYLADFWNVSGVEIHGDGDIAEGMAYNLYGLLQSAGCDELSGIPVGGLSGGEYGGQYFCDDGIYIFQFFLLTRPEHAKSLLKHRYFILDSAREHARLLGHSQGALYPRRTITGGECAPDYTSGSAQYHITADVANSFLQYYHATKDFTFMAEMGAEVLIETARLWIDAGQYDRSGRLCFNGVTGPDGYARMVNNNYFTNLSAKHNLLAVVDICEALKRAGIFFDVAEKLKLSEEELTSFEKAADDIYLPYDEELDINPQYDGFLDKPKWDLTSTPKEKFPLSAHYHPLWLHNHQVLKRADTVLAHYLYEDARESAMKNSYDYYEAITTHDSSMSAGIFSVMASRLGMPGKAYSYFLRTARVDLDNTMGNTKDGIHTAAMGGAYLAVTSGFAGLRIKADGLHFSFTLPKAWSGYDFSLKYAGSLLHVSVKEDDVRFALVEGEPVVVFVDDLSYVVRDNTSLKDCIHCGK